MSTEENKAIVLRHLKEVLEQGRVELIDSYTPLESTNSSMFSRQGLKDTVLSYHKHCPGFTLTILNIMAEGDKVMAHIQYDMTYSVQVDPPEDGVFPFGKPVSWRNLIVFTLSDGMIVAQDPVTGMTDALIEAGAIPTPDKVVANKAVAQRFVEEAWNQGKLEVLDEIYAPDGSDPEIYSLETLKGNITYFHKYAPGIKFTALDRVADDDTVLQYWRVDFTYSIPAEPPPDEFFFPLGKPISFYGFDKFRIVGGKIVSYRYANEWADTLVKIGVIPLEKIKSNKAAVVKFADALNRQDAALLSEVCTPETAKGWIDALPGVYANMKDHHIELSDMVADGESVAVKLSTSGYHTGEMHGLPASGKWWTNRVFAFIRFTDGKIAEVDLQPDVENIIQQIGGIIKPVTA